MILALAACYSVSDAEHARRLAAGVDRDDADARVYPGSHAPETPGDGTDDDCDGNDDCDDPGCDGWPDVAVGDAHDEDDRAAESHVDHGSAGGFDPASPLALPVYGVYGTPVIVGRVD